MSWTSNLVMGSDVATAYGSLLPTSMLAFSLSITTILGLESTSVFALLLRASIATLYSSAVRLPILKNPAGPAAGRLEANFIAVLTSEGWRPTLPEVSTLARSEEHTSELQS